MFSEIDPKVLSTQQKKSYSTMLNICTLSLLISKQRGSTDEPIAF